MEPLVYGVDEYAESFLVSEANEPMSRKTKMREGYTRSFNGGGKAPEC